MAYVKGTMCCVFVVVCLLFKSLSHFNDALIDHFSFLSAAEHRHCGHITTLWSCSVDHICNCCSDNQSAHTVSKVVSQKTKQGGWKTPSSVVVGGVSVNRLDRTFPICLLQQWWFNPTLLLQSLYHHIAICHVLVEIEKHGSSQFIHYYMPSINSSSKKEPCFITWLPEVLYRLTLPTRTSTLPVCTYIETWDQQQKLCCWTYKSNKIKMKITFLAAYAINRGGCNTERHKMQD